MLILSGKIHFFFCTDCSQLVKIVMNFIKKKIKSQILSHGITKMKKVSLYLVLLFSRFSKPKMIKKRVS